MARPKRDWQQPCPNRSCAAFDSIGDGNITAISTYQTRSGTRHIFRCQLCKEQFSETRDTVLFGLHTPENEVIRALKMLLVGCDLQDISYVLGYTEETILKWLQRSARHVEAINAKLLRNLSIKQVQLDEMWAFIARKRSTSAVEGLESPENAEDGRQWIWIGFDPDTRLMLAATVGPRTMEMAKNLMVLIAATVCGLPAFFSDGMSSYYRAIVETFGTFISPEPTGKRGRPKKGWYEPPKNLIYGQLVKEHSGRRLVGITKTIISGAEEFARQSLSISTSLIERLNLTLRGALAPLTRKGLSFCKKRERLQQRTTFFQGFYNYARPHMSLRQPLPEGEQSPYLFGRVYEDRSPAMAAKITDHVWSFKELLTAKIGRPPSFQSTRG